MKMDPHLVSQENHELAYIAKKFSLKTTQVRKALKAAETRSRKRFYNYLRQNFSTHEKD